MLTNYLLTRLLVTTAELFVAAALYHFGVPVQYLVAFGCTYYIVDSINRLHNSLYRYYRSVGTELLVQSSILGKLANVDDKQVAESIMQSKKESLQNQAS